MNRRSNIVTYIIIMSIGGVSSLIFIILYSFISSKYLESRTFEILNLCIGFISLPVWYLFKFIGRYIGMFALFFFKPLYLIYWIILGMLIACGLFRLYLFIFRERHEDNNSP